MLALSCFETKLFSLKFQVYKTLLHKGCDLSGLITPCCLNFASAECKKKVPWNMNIQQCTWIGEKVKQMKIKPMLHIVVPASHMTKRVVVAIEGVMFAVTMVCQHREQYVIQIYTDCNFCFYFQILSGNSFTLILWNQRNGVPHICFRYAKKKLKSCS